MRYLHVAVAITIALVIASFMATNSGAASSKKQKTWATLAQDAQREVARGGIYGRSWGAVSPRLKQIATEMIYFKFGRGYAGKKAWCYAYRESGLNPMALSRTNDHHLFQLNYAAHHHSIDFSRLDKPDVAYGVEAAYRMSHGGSNWSPWNGGSYSCPRGNEP